MITLGSLFTGIGGLDLGLERAGLILKFQVEIDPFCNKVLEKHWPKVRRYGDIKEINWSKVEKVDCVCGGFPCPPVSCAGKRKGSEDERWLWPEFERCIRGIRPEYVVIENVRGLLSSNGGREFSSVLRSLSECGYDAEWSIVSAESVGAPHRRERVFILAYRHGYGFDRPALRPQGQSGLCPETASPEPIGGRRKLAHARRLGIGGLQSIGQSKCGDKAEFSGEGEGLALSKGGEHDRSIGTRRGRPGLANDSDILGNPDEPGPQGRLQSVGRVPDQIPPWPPGPEERDKWASILATHPELAPALPVKSNIRRVADGIPFGLDCHRINRLKALGNAVVPRVAEIVGRRLLELIL